MYFTFSLHSHFTLGEMHMFLGLLVATPPAWNTTITISERETAAPYLFLPHLATMIETTNS